MAHKPFVVWIWGGAVIMCIGGIFSISDKRYRIKKMAKWRDLGGVNNSDEQPGVASQKPSANNGGKLIEEHT
jgi:cytochrome c-type biogenesis protein CcmF